MAIRFKSLLVIILAVCFTACRGTESFDGTSIDENSSKAKSSPASDDTKKKDDSEDKKAIEDQKEDQMARLYLSQALESDNSSAFFDSISSSDLKKALEAAGGASLAAKASAKDPTAQDMEKTRLERMVKIIIKLADTDDDGKISREEFLDLRIANANLGKAARERIEHWRNGLFTKFSGEDELLDKGEIKLMLTASRKYVDRQRGKNGGFFQRLVSLANTLWQGAISRYDKDSDGKIDSTERDNLEVDGSKLFEFALDFIDKDCAKEDRAEAKECKLYNDVIGFCEERNDIFKEILCSEFDQWLADLKGEDLPEEEEVVEDEPVEEEQITSNP